MMRLLLCIVGLALASGQNVYGDHEYYVEPSVETNSIARRKCREMGGILAVVYNSSVNDFIDKLIKRRQSQSPEIKLIKAFWIGLQRNETNRELFVWDDGSSLVYSNWASGEPDNGGEGNNISENCTIIGHPCCGTFTWFDVNCNQNFARTEGRVQPGYICQKQLGSNLTTSTPSPTTRPTLPDARTTKPSFTEQSTLTSSSSNVYIQATTFSTTLNSISSSIQPTTTTSSVPPSYDNSLIIFPIVVGTLLIVVLLIIGAFLCKKKLKDKTKPETTTSSKPDDSRKYENDTEKNEDNIYDMPDKIEDNFEAENYASCRMSVLSQTDSFDDDIPEADLDNRNSCASIIEEGTYCSVDELNDDACSPYVPLSVLNSQENTYNIPDPLYKPSVDESPGNVYDSLAITS